MVRDSSSKRKKHPDIQHVCGISGPIGAGKTTVSNILRDRFGYSVLSFGDLITARGKERNIPLTRDALQLFGQQLIDSLGYDALLEELLSKMDTNPLQVVEGVRHPAIATLLRRAYTSRLILIYVDAPLSLRYQRASLRQKFSHQETLAEFKANDQTPIELGVRRLKPQADVLIWNGPSTDMTHQIAHILTTRKRLQ